MLSGLRIHLQPELKAEFAAEFLREMNRLNAARDAGRVHRESEFAKVTRQIKAIIEAIKDGLRTAGMKDELLDLESRKAVLERKLADTPAPAPMLHPAIAEIYRERVANLHAELNRPEMRAEALQVLGSLIDEIRLILGDGALGLEIAGDLAGDRCAGPKRRATRPGHGRVASKAGCGDSQLPLPNSAMHRVIVAVEVYLDGRREILAWLSAPPRPGG